MTQRATAPPARLLSVERLSDRLATMLAEQIESGALRPGDRLPTEAQLALAHGVSRTVVREALHQLRSRGLLRSRQGSGAFVEPPTQNQPLRFDPTVLGSTSAVVHVIEVRRTLEGEIAALAAERATPAQIAALREALAALDAAVAAGQDGVAEDLAFHRCIAETTGNPQFGLLLGFLEQYLSAAMRLTRGNEARHLGFARAVRVEHAAIVAAIAAHDAPAARRMALSHIPHGAQRLVEGGVIPAAELAAVSRRAPRRPRARPADE